MKKILVLLFLMLIGTSVYGQDIITNKGYTQISNDHWYESRDGVLYIIEDAWSGCDTIKPYVLVRFPQNKNVTEYTILDGVVTIAKGAFQGNKYIQTIKIPSSVYYIGDNAFADCENLKTIEVYGSSSSNQTQSEGDLNKDGEVNIADINRLVGIILGYVREHPEILNQVELLKP